MKIAIFTDTYLPEINGIVTSIKNFTERQAKKGHEFYIFCPKYDHSSGPKIPGIKVIRFPAFAFSTNQNTKIALPSFLKVMRVMRKIRPDVIHIQTPMSIGVMGLVVSKILDIPNIQTYHTYIPDFMVYVSPKKLLKIDDFYERLRDASLVKKAINSPAFRDLVTLREEGDRFTRKMADFLKIPRKTKKVDYTERFAWDFTRFLYGKADLVLAPSLALCRMLEHHHVNAPIEFQSNGIEYNYFIKKKSYVIHQRIVHVGRLGLEKDVDVVIRAVSLLLPKYPHLTLDIIGDGPARPILEKLVAELGIGENVRFLGFVARSKLRYKYRSYDFFVTASAIETQGLVILEAMASGLPAVGVKKLAAPEVIINDRTGYLAKPKNPASFADKTELLLKSRIKNQRLGQGALEMALSHHIYGEVDKLENYYMEVIFRHLNLSREQLELIGRRVKS